MERISASIKRHSILLRRAGEGAAAVAAGIRHQHARRAGLIDGRFVHPLRHTLGGRVAGWPLASSANWIAVLVTVP